MKKAIIFSIFLLVIITGCTTNNQDSVYSDKEKILSFSSCNDYMVNNLYGESQSLKELIMNDTQKIAKIENLSGGYNNTAYYLEDIQIYKNKGFLEGYLVYDDSDLNPTADDLKVTMQIYQIDNLSSQIKKTLIFNKTKDIFKSEFKLIKIEKTDKEILGYPLKIVAKDFMAKPTQCLVLVNITTKNKDNYTESDDSFFLISDEKDNTAWEMINASERTIGNVIIRNYTLAPFLWRIEGETPSYIFGTIHVNDPRILTIPSVVHEALINADQVYTEIDLSNRSYSTTAIIKNYYLEDGVTLIQILPKDIYDRLDKYLASMGYSILRFSNIKVWIIAFDLGSIVEETSSEEPSKPVLDQWIYDYSAESKIKVLGIESKSEQISTFQNLNLSEQIEMLNDSLTALEKEDNYDGDFLIMTYLLGNEKILENSLKNVEADDLDEKIDEGILKERNKRMAARLADKIKSNPKKSYFMAVGVAHYLGNESIIALLKKRGFNITRVDFEKQESCKEGYFKEYGRCYYYNFDNSTR